MSKCEGWVAKYSEQGYRGAVFMPGCFDACDRTTVSLFKDETSLNDRNNPDAIVGWAELEVREEGLYAKCNVNDILYAKPEDGPKSFCFYGNKCERNENGAYTKIVIRCLSLSNNTTTKTSEILSWEGSK